MRSPGEDSFPFSLPAATPPPPPRRILSPLGTLHRGWGWVWKGEGSREEEQGPQTWCLKKEGKYCICKSLFLSFTNTLTKLWEKIKILCIIIRNVVLEKTLESPLDCKEIQPVHSKGDWPWVFFGRNDAKAETPVLWPPHAKS